MKGVVNAALGQELGSVSISVNPLRVGTQMTAQSVKTNVCFCVSEETFEKCPGVLSAGRRLGERMWYAE